MFTKGAQCTGNFVFKDRVGRVYVGYASHCAGKGAATDTNGCNTRSHPLGTRVRFADDATVATNGTTVGHGTLVYSSWIKMHRRHTQNRAGLRGQRLRAGAGRPQRPPQGEPLGPVLGRPDRPLHRRGTGRHPRLLVGPLQPATR